MSTSKILQALEHTDPIIRKKAVIALGKSQDPQSLTILMAHQDRLYTRRRR